MQSDTIYTTDLESFSQNTITLSSLPVEVEYVLNESQRIHSNESVSVVELGKQLLQYAKSGDTEIVRDLMCRGAPFQADQMGTNALHFAAQNNHLETADVLLRAGISRDARTKVDRTPLHMAAYEGHDQMAILLLRYGADVDCRDMLKMTPLHWAIECEHEEVMHVLLDHGADPKALSKFDKTPITLAFEHHRLDLVDIMQQERQIITPKPIQYHQRSEFDTQNLVQMKITGEFEQQPLSIHQHHDNKIIQVPVVKKPKIVYQNIHITPMSDDDQDNSAELIEKISNISHRTFNKSKTALETTESPFELLEAIMVPPDKDSNIVENAVASGGKLVMTEAGKRAYNLTGVNQLGVKRLQLGGTRKGVEKKIISIARTDQFYDHTMPTIRGPNILKKINIGNKTCNFTIAALGNHSTNVSSLEKAPKKSLEALHSQEVKSVPLQLIKGGRGTDNIDSNDDSRKHVTDIVILYQQLAEARKMAADYQKKYENKEAEAEIYKKQLKKITSQKTEK